ncbi:hypothetical protein E2C01_028323 [Portunus trituberculatus]|uniref:Uncharacterized protein n=1 Tax=Portunus trituberculatus TaxID=210409 RepID=A0A5B7EP04_PORTR|nr:hypothetical protein [Portunus trituberculatus]
MKRENQREELKTKNDTEIAKPAKIQGRQRRKGYDLCGGPRGVAAADLPPARLTERLRDGPHSVIDDAT